MQLKVCHILFDAGAGGAEILVRDLSIELAQLGVQCAVVYLNHGSRADRDFEFETLKKLESNNIRFVFLDIDSSTNLIRRFLILRKFLKEFKPHILHCHLYRAVLWSMLFVNPKTIFTQHSYDIKLNRLHKFLLKVLTHRIIGISDLCAQRLSSVLNSKVSRIDNGIDSNNIVSRVRKYSSINCINFVAVGRLSKVKNYALLINALNDFDKRASVNWTCKIAGTGSENDSLHSLVEGLGLGHKILFCGSVRNVPELLQNCDVFLLTSLTEGLPLALIEASVAGLPIITTNVGACPELVNRLENGIVVIPNSPAAMSAALQRVVSAPDEFAEYSKNSINARKIYSMSKCAREHLVLYEKLVDCN